MNFEHTESRRILADSLSRYLSKEYPFDKRMTFAASEAGYCQEKWKEFAELGMVSALFRDAEGGLGGTGFDIAILFEELGKALVVEPFLSTLMTGRVLALDGTEFCRKTITNVISGQYVLALAHLEPDSYFDEFTVSTSARKIAQGWILNGTKAIVQNGSAADALIVTAHEGGDSSSDSISTFLVPTDSSGLVIRSYPLIDGGKAADVILQDVHIGPEALIGKSGMALSTLKQAHSVGVLALCAEALGIMEVIKSQTSSYMHERIQFGVPLATFQALQHRFVDLVLEIEQSRSAIILAAAALDTADAAERDQKLSTAKYTIGRVGNIVSEEAIQFHGGIGMTWEYALSHYAKRLIMIDHQLGDMDFHLQRVMNFNQSATINSISNECR